jgi:hypothetical protein
MQRIVLHSTPTRHLVDDGEGAVGPVPQQEVIASRQNPSGPGPLSLTATAADLQVVEQHERQHGVDFRCRNSRTDVGFLAEGGRVPTDPD